MSAKQAAGIFDFFSTGALLQGAQGGVTRGDR